MSTKNTIEISNKESDESFREIINSFFDIGQIIQWSLLLLLWIVPSILSVYESAKHCNNQYIGLSFVPVVNIILYFTLKNICSVRTIPKNVSRNNVSRNTRNNVSRNGVGIRSTNVYPSAVYKN
jgi:hypothetical protein